MAKRKPKSKSVLYSPEGDSIYIIRNGLQEGPFSIDKINSFLDYRTLKTYDLAWYEGLDEWILIKDLQGVELPEINIVSIDLKPSWLRTNQDSVKSRGRNWRERNSTELDYSL